MFFKGYEKLTVFHIACYSIQTIEDELFLFPILFSFTEHCLPLSGLS